MFLSGLKCLSRLERQVKFAKNRCCKIKPVAVIYQTASPMEYSVKFFVSVIVTFHSITANLYVFACCVMYFNELFFQFIGIISLAFTMSRFRYAQCQINRKPNSTT